MTLSKFIFQRKHVWNKETRSLNTDSWSFQYMYMVQLREKGTEEAPEGPF